MTYEQHKFQIRTDPSVSYWLKAAIEALDKRDPVDAYNDVQTLAMVLGVRRVEIVAGEDLSADAVLSQVL